MMIVADQDRVEDGDRVIIFNGVTIQELRKFDSDIYCDFPCFGWNPLDIPKPLKIVAEEEYDGDCTVQWGASHQQAEAEAGKLPLGLVAAPAPLTEAELSVLNLAAALSEAELTSPAVGASSDCVLADLAEGETKHLGHLVNSESVFEAEASPVSERGAGHQGPEGQYRSVWWPPPPLSSLTTVTASSPSLPRPGEFRSRRRPPWSPRLE